jgi:hypothetical protein
MSLLYGYLLLAVEAEVEVELIRTTLTTVVVEVAAVMLDLLIK